MKRTRRIEITRYRRTVTVIRESEDPTDRDADSSPLEVVANDWEVRLPADEVDADRLVKVVLSDELPNLRPWSYFNFREWLRERF
jgi:hypothetical protein